MKLIPVHALLVPLLSLSAFGCRGDYEPTLYRPRDMIAPSDLGTNQDAGPAADMVTRPADMVTPAADMRLPPNDMIAPPVDMPPPGDMPPPSGDMPPPTDDMPTPTDDMMPASDMMMPPVDMSGPDLATPPDPSEFIVLRVGDGTAALTSAATAAFLERRKVSDGAAVGTPIALPITVTGANRRLTLAGSAASEGSLSRTENGKYLVFGGYDAAVGTASVGSSSSATINRVIGRLDSAGVVDTSTAGDFLSAGSLRGATSTDGSALWAAGSNAVVYTTIGSTLKPTALLTGNMRWLQIASGQLYVSSGSAANHGINSLGTGTPTTATTATLLNGFAADSMSSYYGFLALDRDGMPGVDVIYAADDRDLTMGGGIQRWTLKGTTWTLDGTIKKGLTAGARGLTGFITSGKVLLLATTADVPPRVVSFVDDGTTLDMLPSKFLNTAVTNTGYRGIALPPQ